MSTWKDVMCMADMVCNDCDFLNITEDEQNKLKRSTGTIFQHFCIKYNKRVIHAPYSEPLIHPCDDCINIKTRKVKL